MTGEALPLATLAPIIISLLPTLMENAPEAFGQIRKFIAGGGDLSNNTGSGYNPRALSPEPLAGVYEEAPPLATLAPIIISLLPTIIEKVPDAIDGIKYSEDQIRDIKYRGEALPLATLAPIIVSLLPTIIEKVPDAISGIKKVLAGSGLSDEKDILEAMELLESKGFTILPPNK